jgi:hypothetical protein
VPCGRAPGLPKRSVRMRAGSWPRATSVLDAVSTNRVVPHIYTSDRLLGGEAISSRSCRSIRRSYVSLPPCGCPRLSV